MNALLVVAAMVLSQAKVPASTGAPSDGPRARAQALYDQGIANFRAGAFREAARAFLESFEIDSRAASLFNAGRAYEEANEIERAAEQYERYLRIQRDGSAATEARARLEALVPKRRALAEQRARRRAAGEKLEQASKLTSDGEHGRAAEVYEEAFRLVDDPELVYQIAKAREAEGNGKLALVEVDRYLDLAPKGANRSSALELKLDLEARLFPEPGSTPKVVTDPTTTFDPPVGAYAAAGLGLAALVGSLVMGQLAVSSESELETLCPGRACDPTSNWMAIRDRGESRALVSDVFLVSGIVALGVGVAWWLLDGSSDGAVEF